MCPNGCLMTSWTRTFRRWVLRRAPALAQQRQPLPMRWVYLGGHTPTGGARAAAAWVAIMHKHPCMVC